MNILILGDSHTAALKRGLDSLVDRGALAPDLRMLIQPLGTGARLNKPFWSPGEECAEITDTAYRRKIDRVPPVEFKADVVGLSMPFWFGRVLRSALADDLGLPDQADGRLVSLSVFRQIVLADQAQILGFIDHLRGLSLPLFVIEPPGVFRDNRFLGRIGKERLFSFVQAHARITRDALAQRGVPVIRRPPECTDAEGFMRLEYRHEDPLDAHHANTDFGVLMLREIEGWARAFAASRGPVA